MLSEEILGILHALLFFLKNKYKFVQKEIHPGILSVCHKVSQMSSADDTDRSRVMYLPYQPQKYLPDDTFCDIFTIF